MRDYIITVDEDEAELMHYGVVGMRWHHRRAASYAAKGNLTKAQKHLNKNIKNQNKVRSKMNNDIKSLKKAGFTAEAKANGKVRDNWGNKYTSLSSKDVKRAHRRNTLVRAGMMTAGAAGIGVLAGKAYNKHRSNKLANNPDTRDKVKTATDRLKAYQDAVNSTSRAADNARSAASNIHSTVNNASSAMGNNSRTTVNRSQTPKPKPNRSTVNNTQNVQSVADRLKAYQDAVNNASRAADNARAAASGRGKKKRR